MEGEVALAALSAAAASSGNSARPLSVGGQSSQATPQRMQPGRILVDYFLTWYQFYVILSILLGAEIP